MALFIVAVALTGCTKAGTPEIGFLSLTLPSLKSTQPSPFDQDMDAKGFVLFAGECPKDAASFGVRIDNFPWVPVLTDARPSATAYQDHSGNSKLEQDPVIATNGANVWDMDCSDGFFKFWFYKHEFDSYMAANVPAGQLTNFCPTTMQVSAKGGELPIMPLEFAGNCHDGGSNNPNPNVIATQFKLNRYAENSFYDRGDRCVEFSVRLSDGAGHEAGSGSNTYRFELRNLGVPVVLPAYTDWESCNTSAATSKQTDNLTFPSNTSEFRFYFVPAQPAGGAANYTVVGKGAGLAVSNAVALEFRDAASANFLWPKISMPYEVVPNVCYPIQLALYNYGDNVNQPSAVSSPSAFVMNFSFNGDGVDTDYTRSLNVYSSLADCRSLSDDHNLLNSSLLDVAPGAVYSPWGVYMKVPASQANSERTVDIGTTLSEPGWTFDGNRRTYRVRSAGAAFETPTQLKFEWIPSKVTQNQCVTVRVLLANSEGAPVPANGQISFNVSSAAGGFPTSSCDHEDGPSSKTVFINDGETSSQFQFKPLIAGSAKTVTASTSGLTSATWTVDVQQALTLTNCGVMYKNSTCSNMQAAGGVAPYTFSTDNMCDSSSAVLQNGNELVSTAGASYCKVKITDATGRWGYAQVFFDSPITFSGGSTSIDLRYYSDAYVYPNGAGNNKYIFTVESGPATINSPAAGVAGMQAMITGTADGDVVIKACSASMPANCSTQTFTFYTSP